MPILIFSVLAILFWILIAVADFRGFEQLSIFWLGPENWSCTCLHGCTPGLLGLVPKGSPFLNLISRCFWAFDSVLVPYCAMAVMDFNHIVISQIVCERCLSWNFQNWDVGKWVSLLAFFRGNVVDVLYVMDTCL